MRVLERTKVTPKEVDTFAVPSAKLGSSIARSGIISATKNAEYSSAVVRDGKTLSDFIIEKRTGLGRPRKK